MVDGANLGPLSDFQPWYMVVVISTLIMSLFVVIKLIYVTKTYEAEGKLLKTIYLIGGLLCVLALFHIIMLIMFASASEEKLSNDYYGMSGIVLTLFVSFVFFWIIAFYALNSPLKMLTKARTNLVNSIDNNNTYMANVGYTPSNFTNESPKSTEELTQTSQAASDVNKSDVDILKDKLANAKHMFTEGLISEAEYNQIRAELVNKLK